ncbi:MAG: hypothetical protein R3E76_06775 [Planctomycetota bacterium]
MDNETRSNWRRGLVIGAIVMGVGLFFFVPFWSTFGPAIRYSIDNPETTVESRADIDALPDHVERLAAPTLDDSDLEYLAQRVSVTELDLGDNPNVSDDGMRHVATIKRLEHLSLIRTNVSDKGIRHLRKVPLTYIALWHTKIGDKSLGYIAEPGTMKQLQIKGCRNITDKGVAKLSRLEHLWMVNLCECTQITDKSVDTLSKMPSVNFIQVFDCPHVTDAAIDRFENAQPGRTVHR